MWVLARYVSSLCWFQGVWLGAFWGTMGTLEPLWDFCKCYWSVGLPTSGDWECCEVWQEHAQLFIQARHWRQFWEKYFRFKVLHFLSYLTTIPLFEAYLCCYTAFTHFWIVVCVYRSVWCWRKRAGWWLFLTGQCGPTRHWCCPADRCHASLTWHLVREMAWPAFCVASQRSMTTSSSAPSLTPWDGMVSDGQGVTMPLWFYLALWGTGYASIFFINVFSKI